MWFNPSELLENKTAPLAIFAIPAIFEGENSKTEGKNRKVAKIAEVDAAVVWIYETLHQPIPEISSPTTSEIRDPLDDRHFCYECNNLINKRCIVQRFRPVDDFPIFLLFF